MQPLHDVEFLIATEAKIREEIINDLKECESMDQEKKTSSDNWCDMHPFLRLHCCMTDDRAREALLVKDDGWDHSELDARNHEDRPKTWCEVVAELCNDLVNVHWTEMLPELHEKFCVSIELKFEDMPGGEISADQVKSRCADSRALFIPMVANWEQSGNGFGQHSHKDASWGHHSEEHQDGDNRQSFLNSDRANQEHLLHFWHMSDTEGILENMLNVFAKDVRIDCDGQMRVATSGVQHKRKKTSEEEDEVKERKAFRVGLNQSASTVAITAIRENLAATMSKAADYEIKALTEQNPKIMLNSKE